MKITYDLSYQYKSYPFSPRATSYSQILNYFFSWKKAIIYGLVTLILCVFVSRYDNGAVNIGLLYGAALIVGIVTLLIGVIGQAIVNRIAKKDTEAFLRSNPDVYYALLQRADLQQVLAAKKAPVAEKVVPPAKMDGKNWICPKCGKKNNPVLIRCPKCTTPRVLPDDPPVVRQKPVSDHERAPQPVHQGSQQTQHMTPAQLREPEQKLTELTTRWVCPKCGLVHSKELQVCFHCGTPQTSANKFIQ